MVKKLSEFKVIGETEMIKCEKCGHNMSVDAPHCPNCKTPNWVFTDFCPYCECYHKPSSKVTCSFNRAMNKIFGVTHYD